jgi:transcriptional regulator of met regulon
MARKAVLGGVLAVTLVLSSTAVAANVPRAKLATNADLVCSFENGKLVGIPNPPTYSDPRKATVKQLKASAAWFARAHALKKDEIKRIFALGTPSEPAERVAWNRWHVLLKTVQLPAYAAVAAATKKGDAKAYMAAYVKAGKYSAEVAKLRKTIGLKVRDWDG